MKGMIIKGMAAGILALVGTAFLAVGAANAYPTLGVCLYDTETNMNDCTFSNPDGIQGVFISEDTDDGIVVVVNETYGCETAVSVQWEDLGPVHHFEVEACPPDPAIPPEEPLPLGTKPLSPEPPRSLGDLTARSSSLTPDGRTTVIGGLSDLQEAQQELLILITPYIAK